MHDTWTWCNIVKWVFYFIEVQLIYNVVLLLYSKVIHIYICKICIYILFHILFPYGLPQDTEYSSLYYTVAAAAAKSLQSCPTLCDPIDGSPPGPAVPGILQARTLEWVAISFYTVGPCLTILYVIVDFC